MTVRILKGDCREVLQSLPDESVHCCVTSPPYFGLRDYGVAGQIGLEPSPDEFVTELVAVFRDVRRVLRADGTLWLNLGDSYAASNGSDAERSRSSLQGSKQTQALARSSGVPVGLKPKNLIGIPWRVAFALQAAGWYLRQDIIWSKPNPMPESVTDRCTKAHEYLFLLSKSARYYYDAEAIREDIKETGGIINGVPLRGAHVLAEGARKTERREYDEIKGANRRSVWTVTTQPFSEAHFATFPPALIEPCIKAGTSEKGCCPTCLSPWVRQTEISRRDTRPNHKSKFGGLSTDIRSSGEGNTAFGLARRTEATVTTTGWAPSCKCYPPIENAPPCFVPRLEPAVVLDPFGGAGTTGMVADRLGRDAILIELNPDYAAMAERRIKGDAGMFADVAAE